MRNPVKSRNASAIWAVALAAIAAGMYQFRAPGPDHGWQDVVAVFAGSFVLLALFGVAFYQLEAVRYIRLMRGEDVIARWVVPDDDWQHFVINERERNPRRDAPINIVNQKPRMSPRGVEVVIGKNSLIVGGDFHSLPRAGLSRISGPLWVRGSPPCLEFTVSNQNASAVTRSWTLRFPVASGAHSDAEVVQQYYLNRAPERSAQRDPRRMRAFGAGMAIIGATGLALGMLTFNSNINATLLVVLLVGGILITPGGLLIAYVWHRRMPREYEKYPY